MAKKERHVTGHEWGQIIAHAWQNGPFANLLETDPTKAVKKFLKLDQDVDVIVFQLPPRPQDLTDVQLDAIIKGDDSAYLCPQYSC